MKDNQKDPRGQSSQGEQQRQSTQNRQPNQGREQNQGNSTRQNQGNKLPQNTQIRQQNQPISGGQGKGNNPRKTSTLEDDEENDEQLGKNREREESGHPHNPKTPVSEQDGNKGNNPANRQSM